MKKLLIAGLCALNVMTAMAASAPSQLSFDPAAGERLSLTMPDGKEVAFTAYEAMPRGVPYARGSWWPFPELAGAIPR